MKKSRLPVALACLALGLLLAFGAVPLAAVCGDSLLDSGEECDDGSMVPGDGCSAACLIEDGWTCTLPVAAADGTNVVDDPGFEAGTPNPSWNEASTAFGTPLCTVASFTDGGGSGPKSGIWWAWFGGVAGDSEEGSLSQQVVIPATATTLEFELEQIFCDSVGDFLEVRIDGSQVFVTDGCSYAGYFFG
jgi:cysteine-rich repeat protein